MRLSLRKCDVVQWTLFQCIFDCRLRFLGDSVTENNLPDGTRWHVHETKGPVFTINGVEIGKLDERVAVGEWLRLTEVFYLPVLVLVLPVFALCRKECAIIPAIRSVS